jgi:hypothetical protein
MIIINADSAKTIVSFFIHVFKGEYSTSGIRVFPNISQNGY